MHSINTKKTITSTSVALTANNIYPSFIGADSDEGTTVIKPLPNKLLEELHFMYVSRLNHHTLSMDNNYSYKYKGILDPFTHNGLDFSTRYEIKRNGNSFKIQKINAKGKVYVFFIHVSVKDGELQYRYVWKKKPADLMKGNRIKMRMFATHQLGITPAKLYKVAS